MTIEGWPPRFFTALRNCFRLIRQYDCPPEEPTGYCARSYGSFCTCRQNSETSLVRCPNCQGEPFDQFTMRVYSPWRRALGRPDMAIICWRCKEIVGYQTIEDLRAEDARQVKMWREP